MKGEILSVFLIIILILGSFGATGISYSKDKKDNLSEIEYLQNIAEIKGWTFDIGVTSVSNKNIDELCKFNPPQNWWEDADFNLIKTISSLPDSFDWRSEGGVTPVKDQGNCGSCWAFGTVAPLESAIKIKEGITADLSEQWLVSCNRDGWGCNGGWWAHDYHQWKQGECGGIGAVYESDFPYTATDGYCNGEYNHPYLLEDWAFIGSENSVPQTDAIKQVIYDYGPVSAAVTVTSDWTSYAGGVYNNNAIGRVNHAITLVGWDDTLGKNGCWILKNSWGTNWGENGYMYIEYGCSNVGYSACYIDGYRGPPSEVEEEVTFTFKEITNDPNRGDFEDIDPPFNKPEWYYRLGAEISGEKEYQFDYNIDPDGWWIFQWISHYTWEPDNGHVFITDSPNVEFSLKVMDDDLWPDPDDLADVSAKLGGGEKNGADQEKRCAIYHGTYNLVTDELTGDEVSDPDSNGIRTTIGDGDENAKVWFKIEDTYEGDLYKPDLKVTPTKLDFGEKKDGTYNKYFTVKNSASVDPNDWAEELEWTATDNKDWITIGKSSGSLNGGESDSITVTADASSLSKGVHTGKITVNSNDGSEEINVEITVKGASKEKNQILKLDFIRNLFSIFKIFFPMINF